MRQAYYFLLFGIATILISCGKDLGKITVTYQEASAIYGSIDDIRSQPLNGDLQEIVNPGKIFVSEDFILIGEEEKGIHVIDNSDAGNPVNIAFINIPGNREFIVKDNAIYAESYYDMLKVDITNISQAELISRATNVFGEELQNDKGETLIGFTFQEVTREFNQDSDLFKEISQGNQLFIDYAQNIIPKSALPSSFAGSGDSGFGVANRIAQTNGHVYIIGRNQIHVIEDSNFEHVNSVFGFSQEMETIFPYEDKLFVGTRNSMDILDIREASNPNFEYSFSHATSCDPVLPVKEAAYITLRTADFSPCPGNINALIVLNINNLESPVQQEEIPMISPYGMSMIGDMLFVGEGSNGLKVFDASNKLELEQLVYNPAIEAYDIIAHPTQSNLVLIAGPNGLSQYEMDSEMSFNLESHIDF